MCTAMIQDTEWTIRGSNPGTGRTLLFSSQSSRPALRPPVPTFQWLPTLLGGVERQGPDADRPARLAPRLRMSGVIPLLPLYVFMARKGTAFFFYSRNRVVCLNTSDCGSKIPVKLWNVVLEKGVGQVDRSC